MKNKASVERKGVEHILDLSSNKLCLEEDGCRAVMKYVGKQGAMMNHH